MKYIVLSLTLSVVATLASTNCVDEAGFNTISDSSYRVDGKVKIAPLLANINSNSNYVGGCMVTSIFCSVTNSLYQSYDPVQNKLDYAKRLNSIPRPVAAVDELIEAIETLNKKVKQLEKTK